MALITTNILVERIRKLLSAGYPNISDRVKNAEIKYHIASVANRLLKIEMFNTTFNLDGDSIPDGAMIATYEKVPVTKGYGNTAVCDLPATPMMMPDKMGVYSVYPNGQPGKEFIYVPSGNVNILLKDKLLSPLDDTIYTWDSGKVTIYQDLIGAGVTKVDMKLCIMDISKYGDNDVLPITPEIEADIIKEVVGIYINEQPKPREESLQPAKQ